MPQPYDLYTSDPTHLVQLYNDESQLIRNVGTFLREGLRADGGLLVVAEPHHVDAFMRQLKITGADPEELKASGRLVTLDAAQTLAQICTGRHPDAHLFQDVVGSLVHTLSERHQRSLRIYGEMVALLWEQSRYAAAIRLEHFWNSLLRSVPAKLFCAYKIDVLADEFGSVGAHAALCAHDRVLPFDPDGRLDAAMSLAMDDVLGPSAENVKEQMQSSRPKDLAHVPTTESAILWLHRNVPEYARPILARTRVHYGEV